MNSLIVLIVVSLGYVVAYRTFGRFLARRIFELRAEARVPSRVQQDDVDFIPARTEVLFGHHFASIAGIGPIVGPAIGVIWGWGPALLWIVFGAIFLGAVHDLGALVVSLRHQGRSIGDLAAELINPRVRTLFLLVIFFELWIVIAIFALIIGLLFNMYPQSLLPVWLQIPIAVVLGKLLYRRGWDARLLGAGAVVLMYITIFIGASWPVVMPGFLGLSPLQIWIVVLLIYAFIASVLPVSTLLQPRDFINAFQLLITMVLLAAGVVLTRPALVAPVLNLHPSGAPPMWPYLFTIIACGAISGFHCLVSSGTSSKQCANEPDALCIGFGSMLTEGVLAVLVIIAVAGGLGLGLRTGGETLVGSAAFAHQYASWQAANGLSAKLNAFIIGASNMMQALRIPMGVCKAIVAVFIVSFAATTLDSAARIQRYVVSELSGAWGLSWLRGKRAATSVGILSAFLLAFANGSGQGALTLWPLFGAVNQLLAALALLVITVYLARQGRPVVWTAVPLVFMVVLTVWAMLANLGEFLADGNILLLGTGAIVLALEVWMLVEGAVVLGRLSLRRNGGR